MDYPDKLLKWNLPFNPEPPTLLHLDLNSCFATIEQQANPYLRGKPIAVAAYNSPGGCILAPSIEAKRYGIKTGMSVREGKQLYQNLIILEPDPWKYRSVHLALKKLTSAYTHEIYPKSIDEFVLNLQGCPAYNQGLTTVGQEIKTRIKKEIGEWLTISVGIAPNRYLAKIAAGLKKPDGLDVIDASNYQSVYSRVGLTDLTGIKQNNAIRLNTHGVFSVSDFYNATPMQLQQAFHAVTGHYWYLRLRGYEVDDLPTQRRSYSNSVALGKNLTKPAELAPILANLVEKMSARMRNAGYSARGVHLSILYKNCAYTKNGVYTKKSRFWHKGMTIDRLLYSPDEIYKVAYLLLTQAPATGPVHILAVSCFNLAQEKVTQPGLFGGVGKKRYIAQTIDSINKKWGDFVVKSAKMLPLQGTVKDRIAFGGVKELEEIVLPEY